MRILYYTLVLLHLAFVFSPCFCAGGNNNRMEGTDGARGGQDDNEQRGGRNRRPQDDDQEYQRWRNVMGPKRPPRPSDSNDPDDDVRYGNFKKHRDFVASHNDRRRRGEVHFNVSLNDMADLNETELAWKLGFRRRSNNLTTLVGKFTFSTPRRVATTKTTRRTTTKTTKTKRPTTTRLVKTTTRRATTKTTKTKRPTTTRSVKTTTRRGTASTTTPEPWWYPTTTLDNTESQYPNWWYQTTPYPYQPHATTQVTTTTTSQLPSSLDWRQKGAVSTIWDQGSCGSCWAFSSAGALEGRLAVKTGSMTPLSVQNLLDCAGPNYGTYGCDGGTMQGAFDYVKTSQGDNTWSAYPYKGIVGSCSFDSSPYSRFAPIQYYVDMTGYRDNTAIMSALQSGPVSASLDAGGSSFFFYSGGIYDETYQCDWRNPNHAVLIVGYGVDSATAKPYWLVKNTWGTNWGEQGYVRILRGSNICGIETGVVYPMLA